MADILATKLDALAALTAEARAILDDERADMHRECEARVALAVADRDAAIVRAEKAEARAKAGISAHDDVDAAGWVERVATALGLWYEYDHGPFIANESAEVVARIKADQADIARVEPTPNNARVVFAESTEVDTAMKELIEAAQESCETFWLAQDLLAAIRAEKIRAVLACQWGVAVALVFGIVADLPTAEDIVDGVTRER